MIIIAIGLISGIRLSIKQWCYFIFQSSLLYHVCTCNWVYQWVMLIYCRYKVCLIIASVVKLPFDVIEFPSPIFVVIAVCTSLNWTCDLTSFLKFAIPSTFRTDVYCRGRRAIYIYIIYFLIMDRRAKQRDAQCHETSCLRRVMAVSGNRRRGDYWWGQVYAVLFFWCRKLLYRWTDRHCTIKSFAPTFCRTPTSTTEKQVSSLLRPSFAPPTCPSHSPLSSPSTRYSA